MPVSMSQCQCQYSNVNICLTPPIQSKPTYNTIASKPFGNESNTFVYNGIAISQSSTKILINFVSLLVLRVGQYFSCKPAILRARKKQKIQIITKTKNKKQKQKQKKTTQFKV